MDLQQISEILTRLEQHELRAARILNMVPSENSMSALAKLPMLLDPYHRYFFNDGAAEEPWEFRGVEELASLETELARPLLRELAGAEFVNVRALSGLNLMTLTLSALGGPPGSEVMLLSRAQGGHYATASVAARLGLKVCYATGPDAHTIDETQLAETLRARQPGLVYIDQSNALFPLDVERLARIVRHEAPSTLLHIDASHWMGLVLGRQLLNPLAAGADSFGGSTHKTFPGPQKALFATNRRELFERFRATQQYMVSSHHFGATISLALALLEFKHCHGEQYAAQVVVNTRRFGAALDRLGLELEGKERGFSAGHQLWIRTRTSGVDAFSASQRLFDAGIRTNAYPSLPGISEPVLRAGLNEPTYHGLVADDMEELAELFVAAIRQTQPAEQISSRVAAMRARYRFPYRFPSDDPKLLEQAMRLVRVALTQPME
ncbi:hypothetical protein [Vitiosangium sp. GDMCC 1.1324]|uniref:hypothetical protein n=1 Tax=Vitiosangium sp. (strain GDMCC 1.1324) TaxID=2138576 RepID=UPI000D3C2500|nr:hypothetical protein [Vitiosangium sp. GDMCC 1.1324]PTL85999.1 hypothetical protein DAT35_03765 [Vitiosangium sp. GDMCC 1.1324]